MSLNRNIYNIGSSYNVMNTISPKISYLNKIGLHDSDEMDKFCENPYNDNPLERQKAPISLNSHKYIYVKNPVINSCNGCGYMYPMDGRMTDNRGMPTILDKPAQVGWVSMDDVSNIDNRSYRAFYDNYSQMNNGNMAYYFDESIAQPFFGPVYTLSSTVDKTIFVDPMGSHKPEYFKKPVTSNSNNVSKDQATRDELSFRDDIISKQQSKYNRTSWTNLNVRPQGVGC
jgi:hypothetical protein